MALDSQSETFDTTGSETPAGSKYRKLTFVAIVYAAWLIWLLYVGLVNYRAGNQ